MDEGWGGTYQGRLYGPRYFRGCEPCSVEILCVNGVQLHIGGVTVGFFECRDFM